MTGGSAARGSAAGGSAANSTGGTAAGGPAAGSAAGRSAAGSAVGGSHAMPRVMVACQECLKLHDADITYDTAFVHLGCLPSEQRAAARAGKWVCGNNHEMPRRQMVDEQLQRIEARLIWYQTFPSEAYGEPHPQPTGSLHLREDQCEICWAVFTQEEWDTYNDSSGENTTSLLDEADTDLLMRQFFEAGPANRSETDTAK